MILCRLLLRLKRRPVLGGIDVRVEIRIVADDVLAQCGRPGMNVASIRESAGICYYSYEP